jgi:hypothetical protein
LQQVGNPPAYFLFRKTWLEQKHVLANVIATIDGIVPQQYTQLSEVAGLRQQVVENGTELAGFPVQPNSCGRII